MLTEPKEGSPEWRCWNALSADEFSALTDSRRPLEGCICRGCIFLKVRGIAPIARSELLPEAAEPPVFGICKDCNWPVQNHRHDCPRAAA